MDYQQLRKRNSRLFRSYIKKRKKMIGVFLLLLLFFPIRIVIKEKEQIVYKSLTYSITKYPKRMQTEDENNQLGIMIKLFNHIIYENRNILEKNEKIPAVKERMLRLHDTLYYDTKIKITTGRCGVGIYQITDFIEETKIPLKNGQVNFKGDIKYQEINNKHIDVWINDSWYRFESKI